MAHLLNGRRRCTGETAGVGSSVYAFMTTSLEVMCWESNNGEDPISALVSE